MPFARRLLSFLLPYRQRETFEFYDVEPTTGRAITELTAWDWADLNLLIFQNGSFWADWLTDWLFPIVSGTATQVGAVRGDVAEVRQDLVDMELRLGAAIAGAAGQDLTVLVNELHAGRVDFLNFHNALIATLFQTTFDLATQVNQLAPSINAGMSAAAREVAAPLRDVAATFLNSLGPILEGVTKDFVGDRERVEAALDRVEAGGGGAWTAVLPLILRALTYAVMTGGPIVALASAKEVLEHFPGLGRVAGGVGATFGQGIVTGIELLHGPMRATMGGLAQLFFTELEQDLAALGEADEGNVLPVAAKLLGTAASLGASAHLACYAAEKIAPLKYMGFDKFGAFLSKMAGFEDMAAHTIGVQIEAALREPGRRRANRIHRPNLPPSGVMEQLFHERLAAPEELADYYRAQGWPEHFITRWLRALPEEATPRDLAMVFEDGDVDPLWAQDHLRHRGYTDEDAFRIVEGLRTRAVKSLRSGAVAALVVNYADGLLDAPTLRATLRELRLGEDAATLVLLSAEQRRVNVEAEAIRTLLESAAASGAITVEEIGASMAAYGYDARAQQEAMSRARLRLGVQLFREESSELRAAVRRAQQDSITAAMEQFRRFQLDAGGLANFLRAVGIRDEEVDALVALAVVRRSPVPRLPTVLTPEAALQETLRVERDRILELTRKGLMAEAVAVTALVALGLDPRLARAEAQLAAARLAPPLEVVRPPSLEEIQDASQRALAEAALALFRDGLVSTSGLTAALRSAGIAPALTAAITEREVARAKAELARDTRAQAERELREQRSAQEAAAVAAFRAGRLDAAGLLQNLVGIGIQRATAQAIVDREMLVREGQQAPARA